MSSIYWDLIFLQLDASREPSLLHWLFWLGTLGFISLVQSICWTRLEHVCDISHAVSSIFDVYYGSESAIAAGVHSYLEVRQSAHRMFAS